MKSKLFMFTSILLLLPSLLLSQADKLKVVAERANIYFDPDINSPIIDTAEKGAILTLFSSGKVKGSWYYVLLNDEIREISKPGFTQASLVERIPQVPRFIKEKANPIISPPLLLDPASSKRMERQGEGEIKPEHFIEKKKSNNPYLADWASSLYHCGKWRKALAVYERIIQGPGYSSSQKSEVRESMQQIKKEYGPSIEFNYKGSTWPGNDYVHGFSIDARKPVSDKDSIYVKVLQRYYDVSRRSFDTLGAFVASKEAIQVSISLRHHISRLSYLQGTVGGYTFLSHSYHNEIAMKQEGTFNLGLEAYLAREKGERLHLLYSHRILWDDPLNIVYFQGMKNHLSGDFGIPLKDYLEISGGGEYHWYKGQEWASGYQENLWGNVNLKLHIENPEILIGYQYYHIDYRVNYKFEESFPDIYSLNLHSLKFILRDSFGDNFGFEIDLSLGRDFVRSSTIYELGFSVAIKPKPGHELLLSGSYMSEAIQPGEGHLWRLGIGTKHYF